MDNLSHNQVDFELLGKYLSGEAAPVEAMAVDEWILATGENRKLFDEISAVWEQVVKHPGHRLPDREQFLQELRTRFAGDTRPVKSMQYWRSIAAGLLVFIVAAACLFFMLRRDDNASHTFVSRETTTGILHDTLPDHSIAVLNSHSILQYPDNYNTRTREVQLSGEAWFNVTADPSRPFIIKAGGVSVKVLGTSFNVREGKDSVEVTVKTGSVLVYTEGQAVTATAGKTAVYHHQSGRIRLSDKFNINGMGYATRTFDFENESLQQITAQLEKAYGITVVFENKKLTACHMSSTFDDRSLKYIFEVISITLNVNCRFENNTVYISGTGCN